jgi:hypothetical protein
VSRWDNVGFDGPILENWREYEIPDSLTKGGPNDMVDVAYRLADAGGGPAQTLEFQDVDVTGVTRAQLALNAWVNLPNDGTVPNFALNYRMNGGEWATYEFNEGQQRLIGATQLAGAMAMLLDVTPGDLVAGTNTLELVSDRISTSYPVAALNIDLVLTTD